MDKRYNFENIKETDMTMTLFQKGIDFPVGSTEKLTLGDLASLANEDLGFFNEDEDGFYSINYADTMDLADQLTDMDINSFGSLDGISFSDEYEYHLGIDKEKLAISASKWSNTEIIGFSSVSTPVLSPISKSEKVYMGLDEKGLASSATAHENIADINCSNPIFEMPEIEALLAVTKATGTNLISIEDPEPIEIEPITQPIVIDHTIKNVKSISDIKLNKSAKMIVTISLSNSFVSSGDVIPNIDIDLTKICNIKGFEGKVVNIKDMVLNASNDYSVTKSFSISSLAKSSYDTGNIHLSENVYVNGQIEGKNIVADADLAEASKANGGMNLDVNIHFEDVDIESADVQLSPVTVVADDTKVAVDFSTSTLPSMVERISSVTFDTTKKTVIEISAANLDKVKGLSLMMDELTVEFPASFHIQGVTGNTVTMSGTLPIRKEIVITSIDMPEPKNGVQAIKDNIVIKATATASGTINTASMPSTAADDVVINASINGSPAISGYTVLTKDYSHAVSMDKTLEISAEGIGDLGNCTIIPEGTPSIDINISKPSVSSMKYTSDGLKIRMPAALAVASSKLASGLAYSQSDNSITVNGNVPDKISIPVSSFKLDAEKSNNMTFNVSGSIVAGAASLSKSDVQTLVDGNFGIEVVVPEIKAKSVELEEDLSINIEETSEFTIISKESVPEMVNYISEVVLKDVMLNCSIDFTGLPAVGKSGYRINAVATLPSCISPSEIQLIGAVKDGRFTADPVKITSLKDIDLSSDDVKGAIEIKGVIIATDASIDVNALNNDIKAKVTAKISDKDGNIAISTVKARCDYSIDYSASMSFDDIPDFLKSGDVCLDVKDPQLLLSVNSNAGVPVVGSLEIIPWRNGKAEGAAVSIKDIEFPYSDDPNTVETVKLCIGADASNCPAGYEFREAQIARVFRQIPDSVQIVIAGGIAPDRDCIIDPSAEYVMDASYDFNMPLEAGEDFSLVLSDTLDISEGVIEAITKSVVGLEINATSTIPLDLKLYVDFLDEEGNVIYITEDEVSATIKAGKRGAPVTSAVEAVMKAKAGAPVDQARKLLVSFALTGVSESNALASDDYIQADIIAHLPEGITVDFGKKNTEEE